MSFIVPALMILFIGFYFIGQMGRARERWHGNDRCRACGAHMKRDPRRNGKYATTCSRCGAVRA